ncbi:exosortase [Novosphingobium chloroacetimidivorans]|uniref:Exosortase n=1 Tax=Novosphingobium chloroacetimidivorans TaxID=1428314 RepID=A0A7W7NVK3_9SPHN|nr:exosortase V [Novosphingobium chloroacetimidivorans]MBB4857389.1 exosortase [Novosphingobium chloroacetimidivorans]
MQALAPDLVEVDTCVSDTYRAEPRWWVRHWYVALSALIMAIPGLAALARNYWSTEQGAAGPIILLTGLWLLHHEASGLRTQFDRAAGWLVPLGLVVVGLCTVIAAVTAKQWLQLLGIYLSLIMLLYAMIGWRQLLSLRIPILYLAFVIPPPDNLVVPLTHALKDLVAGGAVGALGMLGYPVARDGVLLYIGQYELVVAAACSGMNSILSLTAIGLFYVYLLHRAHMRYAALLALLMVPVALFANAVRVIALLLITYYGGEAAGQGILHDAAGLFIFLVALGTLLALDRMLAPLLIRGRASR